MRNGLVTACHSSPLSSGPIERYGSRIQPVSPRGASAFPHLHAGAAAMDREAGFIPHLGPLGHSRGAGVNLPWDSRQSVG